MQRKLAAIMVADFVGSTASMEADEEETVACVNACMKAVEGTVVRHDGRVFNTAGDAVLAEFASPVNALRATMEARNVAAAVPGAMRGSMGPSQGHQQTPFEVQVSGFMVQPGALRTWPTMRSKMRGAHLTAPPVSTRTAKSAKQMQLDLRAW